MTSALLSPGGRRMQLIKRDLNPTSPTYGQDQIVLDILGPDMKAQGICLLSGYSGLQHAPRTPIRESSAYQEGSTPSDFPRVEERTIDMRLGTQGRTQREWEEIDSLLWEVLSHTEDAVLRIESEISQPRELKVRLDRKPKDDMTIDPSVTHYMVWSLTLIACDPWWRSSEIQSVFTNTAGTGNGFLTLQNPADRECWVEFSCNQITSTQTWTLPDGVSGVSHTLPSLIAGQEFLVDTYPLNETLMVRDGSQAWARMQAEAFLYSLPRRTLPTQVPIKVVGGTTSSSVTAYMEQRWDRPWGGE